MEKILIISNDFSSEASRPVLLKFHAEPPWAGEWKIAKMGMVHWSYMVKTFKNLLLQNQISPGPLSLHKLWGTGDLPKLLKWRFYVEVCFPMHLYGPYTFILQISKWLAYLQWLCHSGERVVAHGPLVFPRKFGLDIPYKKIVSFSPSLSPPHPPQTHQPPADYLRFSLLSADFTQRMDRHLGDGGSSDKLFLHRLWWVSKISYSKVANKKIYANSPDPDQTAPEGAVWSGLHCLPFH